VDAHTFALQAVLNPEQRFVIPTFQRDYEWTLDGQWRLLFEDLESAAERLRDARRKADAIGVSSATMEAQVSPHFLGAVVCDKMAAPVAGLGMRAVIDGQQRMTTLQLMARGVLDVLIENSSPRVPQVRRLIENPADLVRDEHELHKLWPRRKDREVWPSAMRDTKPGYVKGEHLYLQARRFFADATRRAMTASTTIPDSLDSSEREGVGESVDVSVDTVLTAGLETSPAERLDDIVDALLGLFKLVVIELDPNDDAQVIFEVLNGRQTTLSASDLVKNLLFLRGELAEEGQLDKLYDRYWAPFDSSWWKQRIGTGHAARHRRDVLLSVWLTAASGEEARVGHLYGEVRTYLARSKRKTDDVLAELYDYGLAYQAVYRAPGTEPGTARLGVAYDRLNLLNVTTVVPLLAWLRTLPSSKLPLEDHERAVVAVESWVVRRMLLGINTRGYGQAFSIVLKRAQQAADDQASDVADAVVQALAAAPNTLIWPTDGEVATAFTTDKFYDRFTQQRIRMVLGAIDDRLRAEDPHAPAAQFDYDNLQIEHVMPRSWPAQWPLPSDMSGDPAEEAIARLQRDAAVHRIGNLTLVTPAFNRDVSNSGWSTKRPEFAKQPLKITSLVVQDTWDEDRITTRATELAAVACRVWRSSSSAT
jgi:uncharacterized protein with ParB-like and HNH nuclease domain